MINISWAALADEAIGHLQALVRLDTSNPPGNEAPAAEYLAAVLTREGLTPRILESAPGRANLVVRLTGQGAQPPLMLMSHLDVVPVDAAQWSHPPFRADIADGFLWGRGALDDKLVTVAHLMTVLLCHRLQLPLTGDLVFLAHADEESDFTYGMQWLVRHHRDLFDAPYALYEGGLATTLGGQPLMLVDTAEKGWCTVQVTARGPGGHSSVPHLDHPLYHLAPVLDRLASRPMPVHIVPTVGRFLAGLAEATAASDPALADACRRLMRAETADAALADAPVAPGVRHRFNALVRNTVTPTLLQSGLNRWTLPTRAHMTLNGRLLPGQTEAAFERDLADRLGPGLDYTVEDFHAGAECAVDTPLFDAVRRVVKRHSPLTHVLPHMLTGGTERGLLHSLGVEVIGFCPLRETPGQPSPMSLCHAPDERVALDLVLQNCQYLFEVVCELNGLSAEA